MLRFELPPQSVHMAVMPLEAESSQTAAYGLVWAGCSGESHASGSFACGAGFFHY